LPKRDARRVEVQSAASGGFVAGILCITALHSSGIRRLDSESPQQTHLFLHMSAFSLLKETLAFNMHLLYLDERARSWGPPVRISNGLMISSRRLVTSSIVGFRKMTTSSAYMKSLFLAVRSFRGLRSPPSVFGGSAVQRAEEPLVRRNLQ
jgi:hypothetical protein